MFISAGTGGTITGISRKLKELDPNIKIIGIDPCGSVLATDELNKAHPAHDLGQVVEGIGYDFLPRVYDKTCADDWLKVHDGVTFKMARRLIKEEGFLCGGSSGSAMWGALTYIKEHNIGKGKRCVVLLPDNIRNYMTKFLNADWMHEFGYIEEEECAKLSSSDLIPSNDWGQDRRAKDLKLPNAMFLEMSTTVEEALHKIT